MAAEHDRYNGYGHPKWKCDHKPLDSQFRSKKHDAYFCKDCDVWIEKACKDKTCDFCSTRPEKPSEVTE